MSEAPRPNETALPPPSDADAIDLICDAFEEALRGGKSPAIEEYLDRCDELLRERLLGELLLVDREYRVQRGEIATREAYRVRFPAYADVIDSLEFSTIDERRDGRRLCRSQATNLTVGSRIAQFELLEEIGTGASGTVWKARDTRLHRTVAIKMPRHECLLAAERERFLREGQACAQLRHPNIVAVYETGLSHGCAFIVTEFVDGMDLRKSLSQRRPTYRETTELVAQLAEALHHAHQQGIVHRDLKPANVLMDSNGRPRITDFGLAKWLADDTGMTVEGNILGTPAYMSPEQARGEISQIDERTDVYGLGALLYELLTGSQVFQGDVASTIHHVIHSSPIPPRKVIRTVPRDLETICLKALEKNQRHRYVSAQEMAVDLRRYLRGEPILARRSSLVNRSWKWLRRRPALASSLILAFVLAAACVGIVTLVEKNYRLQGYRWVRVTSNPVGARLAFVPISAATGEPAADATAVIRPPGVTPMTVQLTPGDYFVEAVLGGRSAPPDFLETVTHVSAKGTIIPAQRKQNRTEGFDEDMLRLHLAIPSTREVTQNMVLVPMDASLRRSNPLLPEELLVDPTETTAAHVTFANPPEHEVQKQCMTFEQANALARGQGKRLASSHEYEAMTEFAQRQGTNGITTINAQTPLSDLFGGAAEWTTTVFDGRFAGASLALEHLRDMHVLKGYGNPDELAGVTRLPNGQVLAHPNAELNCIGFRGVRSGRPRFLRD